MGSSCKVSQESKAFLWTEHEIGLLLEVISDYKASKIVQGQDWESVRTKYEDIAERLHAVYPKEGKLEEYPHTADPSVITKDRILSKIKRIKINYKKAVDTGRKSGGGKVVTTFYKECSDIWAGSPSVECINNSLESSEISGNCDSVESNTDILSQSTSSPSPITSASDNDNFQDMQQQEKCHQKRVVIDVTARQNNLLTHLKERRNARMTKRTSAEAQIIDITKEDLSIKKKMLEKLEEGDRKHDENMKVVNETMQSLTKVIEHGFTMMQQLMQQGPQFSPSQYNYLHSGNQRNFNTSMSHMAYSDHFNEACDNNSYENL